MQYVITSRGRPIGVTDLGLPRFDRQLRLGWFHPTPEGERLMPLVAGPVLAMCTDAARRGRHLQLDVPLPQRVARTMFADLMEASHHIESLDFGLTMRDGRPVPAASIGFTDTERLHAFARGRGEGDEDDGRDWEDDGDDVAPWLRDDGEAAGLRYQVMVFLPRGVRLP